MPPTYFLIGKTVLSETSTSVIFSGIPNTYTDLLLCMSVRTSYSGGDMRFRINNNTGSIYSRIYVMGNGTTASSVAYTGSVGNNIMSGNFNGTDTFSNTFSQMEIYIPNYLSSSNKISRTIGVSENNATTSYIYVESNLARDTNPITSIQLVDIFSTGYVAGSSFYLYGIKN